MEVSHPNITKTVDVIEGETAYYTVYEYVEGETFQAVVEKYGVQREGDVIMWAKEIACTLQYLHGLHPPIIFSDLNPRKIFLQPSGQIKIVGLDDISFSEMQNSFLSMGWEIYGSVNYFYAPECYNGNASEKSDIYSLGAMMYFLVTGIGLEEHSDILFPIQKVNPDISSQLEYIIEKCMAVDPAERYQNCEELLHDLEGRTAPSNRSTLWERIRQKEYWKMVFCKK